SNSINRVFENAPKLSHSPSLFHFQVVSRFPYHYSKKAMSSGNDNSLPPLGHLVSQMPRNVAEQSNVLSKYLQPVRPATVSSVFGSMPQQAQPPVPKDTRVAKESRSLLIRCHYGKCGHEFGNTIRHEQFIEHMIIYHMPQQSGTQATQMICKWKGCGQQVSSSYEETVAHCEKFHILPQLK
ncbi:hypothetical protein BJ165DRAFT_1563416, partial [Panaeolus papilionaceus]